MADKTIETMTARFDARVGDKVVIELQGVGGRFTTEFVGWEKGRYILVKLPAKLDLLDHIYPEKPVIVRYLHEGGEVRAFQTSVQAVIHAPVRLVCLDFPKTVETLRLRKAPRADCFLPATFVIAGIEAKGYVVNISLSGARGAVDKGRYGVAEKLAPGAEVSCQFTIPAANQGEAAASGTVRKVIEEREKRLFSMEFASIDERSTARIKAYIEELGDYLACSVCRNE